MIPLKLLHNSRKTDYRVPFGAVVVGTTVTLTLGVEDADAAFLQAQVRLWVDGKGETFVPMQPGANNTLTAHIACDTAEIIWYSFVVALSDGRCIHVGARQGTVGGEGVMYDHDNVPSFQLTVYKHRQTRPSWYENGIVYQIFPDRYARDASWRERTQREVSKPRRGPQKRLVENWDEPPVYDRNEDGSIKNWDFYGGSLEGIRQDLPRLHSLGITAIYLNPIFEAQSNHRYDTADYLNIDPVLGDEDDFKRLCEDAQSLGISIILDGVFNHTGDDSVYFNRYENYPGKGAWQGSDSPWADAYCFHGDGTYDSWWGIANMPALNENSPAVQNLILGENGVIRTWLRAGARGWRLDVADELSDTLIEHIKQAVLQERPDGLLLGEVWEDASNKVSYGRPRRYLLGDELDSAMNYPLRDAILGFLVGNESAYDCAEHLESLRENYPPEALACCLNLLGSHDKPRIASVLGGGPDESTLPEEERGRWRLDETSMGLAKGRFWLATLMQMTFPGVPSIYYGDEYALEGLSDPGNRRTLPRPEDVRDHDMLTMVRNTAMLRRALPFLINGTTHAYALNEDVLCIKRRSSDGQAASILINHSLNNTRSVRVPIDNDHGIDVISGAALKRDPDGCAEIRLWPLGSAAAYTYPEQRLQKPLDPGVGVLAHITSLPNDGRPGTLGAPARRFIDHLAQMGMTYWQVLPVNPCDGYGSPYAGPSAFAGNGALLEETPAELKSSYANFKAHGGFQTDEFFAFARDNESWLDPYCAFMAIKDAANQTSRHSWPEEFQHYDVAIFTDPRFAEHARYHAYVQFRFQQEWDDMHEYASRCGIQIIGDIPMYVSDDSADAWSEPEMFMLDGRRMPREIAGVPPDRFAAEGQVWGNPTYRWSVMQEDGYVWWMARLGRALRLYDRVRLDHFLGFHNYYAIPQGKTGKEGAWQPGPGIELFQTAYDAYGPLPLIAEDLGILTPGVRAMCASCGFPGMDVLQFADYDIRESLHPHPEKIVYTSTHDTQTLVGFCASSFYSDEDLGSARHLAGEVIREALASSAPVVIMQLQDVLGLGDEARMNRPGTAEGNWSWQAQEDDMQRNVPHMRRAMIETGRMREHG